MIRSYKKAAVIGLAVLLAASALTGCFGGQKAIQPQDAKNGDILGVVTTDKARYNPGDTVRFKLPLEEAVTDGTLVVRYKQLSDVVEETEIKLNGGNELSWEWKAPEDDYKGYMAEVYLKQGSEISDHANIAVDVSSDWGKFPRYGYLADFLPMEAGQREAVIERLNRFHINGIQFYDWQWKHHMPLKLENGQLAESWPDIANRKVSRETVADYIDLAHDKNMKAMNYNLLFGAYDDAEADGVKKEWGLYKDPLGTTPDFHPLPASWASNINLYDPSNPQWRQYLFEQEKKTFELLPFDGWHVDQLGDRGNLYNADSKKVDLAATYAPFLQAAKKAIDVDYVMNAVGQYGQAYIASQAPVKFLYTEVWSGHPQYKHLKDIADQNYKFGKGRLNTVFAAYMNYDHADSSGNEFNAPGVLLTDAVIFAAGGSHLELGENMLAKEYFPNRNLTIPEELEAQLVAYYDFLVAYQNVLRDGVEDSQADITGIEGAELSAGAEQGKVWAYAKRKPGYEIAHFINFTDAIHMQWNDSQATQKEPAVKNNVKVSVQASGKVKRVWFASPDAYNGSPIDLAFKQQGDKVEVTLPTLKYWDMVVMEYEDHK
ncbi:glycoside hydrolase family 66 protein [Paenibacillus thermotolerans]|uniref:glycoside hydrolase family 66 protein n=1 Tax=Paenibacillus thermotolerans TaxID=3027807 RepID=UPI0023679F36|nr:MULTISPECIES: glycoside hydrolase family 66 protein [unclassified Paenibacillus]